MDSKDIIADKCEALLLSKGPAGRTNAFNELTLTLKVIMKKEEKLYASIDLPDLDIHIAIHNEFARDLESLREQYYKKANRTTKQKMQLTIDYIEEWIVSHEAYFDSFANSFIRITDFVSQ